MSRKAKTSLALFGAGRMGSALLNGWLASDTKTSFIVVEPSPSDALTGFSKVGKVALNPAPMPVDILVVAVKPQMFTKVAAQLCEWVGPDTLIVSVMAGISLKQLKESLDAAQIVRVMPNTPGAIGAGMTVFSVSTAVNKKDVARVEVLLAPLGDVEGPLDEKLMPIMSGLSGSGPAYLFLLTEVMAYAGEAEGLPADLAMRLARKTVEGAALLQSQSDEAPGDLRKAVTSPGGLTQAALDVLMDEDGMPGLMRRALRAAAARDKELSRASD